MDPNGLKMLQPAATGCRLGSECKCKDPLCSVKESMVQYVLHTPSVPASSAGHWFCARWGRNTAPYRHSDAAPILFSCSHAYPPIHILTAGVSLQSWRAGVFVGICGFLSNSRPVLRRWFANATHRGTGSRIPPLPRAEFGRLTLEWHNWLVTPREGGGLSNLDSRIRCTSYEPGVTVTQMRGWRDKIRNKIKNTKKNSRPVKAFTHQKPADTVALQDWSLTPLPYRGRESIELWTNRPPAK